MLTCIFLTIVYVAIPIGIIFYSKWNSDSNNYRQKIYRIRFKPTIHGGEYIPQWSYFGITWSHFYTAFDGLNYAEESFLNEDECMQFIKDKCEKNMRFINSKEKIITYHPMTEETSESKY